MGGGWAMVFNAIRDPNDQFGFWNIRYLLRFSRKGTPQLNSLFYDGSLYQTGPAEYLDIIEDLTGLTAVGMHASSDGIVPETMQFKSPVLKFGHQEIFRLQFAAGWSSADYDGDTYGGNCAAQFAGTTQHYGACWTYNLAADGDGGTGVDDIPAPHMFWVTASNLALYQEVGAYTRLNRITRFVRW